ncbi:hypothetical protein L9F63_006550 [Diploptera punctata]|uniref:Uncharacterized protein n=1 Tax=Diploptera punctata TaxID=6984 RepID=A0AAD7ZAF0_DIPPU|nr:hypothetical protein L9F63_006550 [Diploptera punctata]
MATVCFISDVTGTVIYFTAKLAITCSYAVIYVFTAELFPTEIRHTLLGSCSMVARLGAITAPQWQVLNNLIEGLPFYIFSFTSITSGGLIFLLPETLKLSLPDTIEDAEKLGRKRRHR